MNGRAGILLLVLALSTSAAAETVYLTDSFQAGLYEDKSLDTPIIKTITAGTPLELIKREKNFAYVRDPQGVSGWIDNSYLVATAPAAGGNTKLRAERDDLAQKLEDSRRQLSRLQDSLAQQGSGDQGALQQQLNSERIKTGELQIQLAELKKRLGDNNDTEALYQQIEDLKVKNKTLDIKLTEAKNQAEAARAGAGADDNNTGMLQQDWKRSVVYFFIYILVGVVLGIYLMDYYNRRRHGGFRV